MDAVADPELSLGGGGSGVTVYRGSTGGSEGMEYPPRVTVVWASSY